MLYRGIVVFVLALTCLACSSQPVQISEVSDDVSGWVLIFDEQRPAEPAGTTRMLVTSEFLRIDSGEETEDFLLYNRQTQEIFNVVHEDESVLVIRTPVKSQFQGAELTWRHETQASNVVVDRMGQHKSFYHRILINDEPCLSLIAVEGLLPEALQAIHDYLDALSVELARGLTFQNSDEVCYLGLNIVNPAYKKQFGFPIREWNDEGYQRFLSNYRIGVLMPKRLFDVPVEYKRIGLTQ